MGSRCGHLAAVACRQFGAFDLIDPRPEGGKRNARFAFHAAVDAASCGWRNCPGRQSLATPATSFRKSETTWPRLSLADRGRWRSTPSTARSCRDAVVCAALRHPPASQDRLNAESEHLDLARSAPPSSQRVRAYLRWRTLSTRGAGEFEGLTSGAAARGRPPIAGTVVDRHLGLARHPERHVRSRRPPIFQRPLDRSAATSRPVARIAPYPAGSSASPSRCAHSKHPPPADPVLGTLLHSLVATHASPHAAS